VEIIKATKADAEPIMEMINVCKVDMRARDIDQWNPYYPNIEVIKEDIQEEALYVIKEEDKPIAVITFNEKQDIEYAKIKWTILEGKFLVIHRLAVHPSKQSKGIARKLMEFGEQLGKLNDFAAIRMDAYSGNPRALALYQSMGYKKTGIVRFPMRTKHFYCFEKEL
jgi:ribosomal protein S18 acetylase RimI-like enzyme